MAANKQTINFTFDHRALSTIIGEQAGSLQKALLECIMNSCDAGATEVVVTLDKYRYSVVDDGHGITDFGVIESFFETFGTPHQEGDATYGVHRIGRGQSFMFSAVTWRTGTFKMFVDVKANGFNTYDLTTGLESVIGCRIDGELYDSLTPTELLNCSKELTELCRYIPTRVILNGQVISVDPATEEWTKVTDDAYIRISKRHDLKIYNLGALVASISNSVHGCGGVIVSRKQLALNWARNDVLLHECKVWPRIVDIVTAEAERYNKVDAGTMSVSSEAYKAYLANTIMYSAQMISAKDDDKFSKAKLFTDIQGKHYSLIDIAGFPAITTGSKLRIDHAKIHLDKEALVLTDNAVVYRFRAALPDVLVRMSRFTNAEGNCVTSMLALKALDNYADIEFFSTADDTMLITPDEKVLPYAKVALNAIQLLCNDLADLTNFPRCQVGAMRSETLYIAMDDDGVLRINQDRFFANKNNLGGDFIPGVALSLLRYLCDDHDDSNSVFHDEEFYDQYFRISMSSEFQNIVSDHFKKWTELGADGSLGVKMLKMCDTLHRHDEIVKLLSAAGQ